MRWKQRSGCAWLQLGDKNTKYFHAVANGRKNRNSVMAIQREDGTTVPNDQLPQFVNHHLTNLIGRNEPHARPFNLTGKVGPNISQELAHLDNEITSEEVLAAINEMPNDKASCPDGLPIEFYKNFWTIIQGDLIHLIHDFFTNSCSIKTLNKATITLIPKKKTPTTLTDYRPISVINTVAKIITKVLANRLQIHLSTLIALNQTAFVKGRSMMDSFIAAREFLIHCKSRKLPAVLYKVDFEKAFDTVDWCFLINLLIERGFPPRWIAALLTILQSSTSAVRLNGNITRAFQHRRGLRQGDLLSLMLFILVADSLNRFLSNTEQAMPPHAQLAPQTIQFTDDTVIIAEAHPLTLRIITRVL